jgi:hypothetical protein
VELDRGLNSRTDIHYLGMVEKNELRRDEEEDVISAKCLASQSDRAVGKVVYIRCRVPIAHVYTSDT